MKPVLPLPLDIRLMRAGTQVLFVLAALLLLAA
ncbi:MAG: cell division protein FtsQ, partial [Betaproteobacteria bacterium]|nr:cell division protein FtsQ [Betaproteobacteria bacterium]